MLGSTVLWLLACAEKDPQPADEAREPIPLVVLPTLDVASPTRAAFAPDASVALKGKVKAVRIWLLIDDEDADGS